MINVIIFQLLDRRKTKGGTRNRSIIKTFKVTKVSKNKKLKI